MIALGQYPTQPFTNKSQRQRGEFRKGPHTRARGLGLMPKKELLLWAPRVTGTLPPLGRVWGGEVVAGRAAFTPRFRPVLCTLQFIRTKSTVLPQPKCVLRARESLTAVERI
jgi:hypothetical protein